MFACAFEQGSTTGQANIAGSGVGTAGNNESQGTVMLNVQGQSGANQQMTVQFQTRQQYQQFLMLSPQLQQQLLLMQLYNQSMAPGPLLMQLYNQSTGGQVRPTNIKDRVLMF